jgi:uracil-DNA glycosylase
MASIIRLQVQQGAKAWVVLVDNDLNDNFFTTPNGEFLGKMLRGIKLDLTDINLLRFSEVQQGRRLSTAHVMQVGEHIAPQIKQTSLPVLMLGQGALHVMLGHDKPMAAVHGQVLDLPLGQRGIATYHPSILADRTELKRRAWDALLAFQTLATPGV